MKKSKLKIGDKVSLIVKKDDWRLSQSYVDFHTKPSSLTGPDDSYYQSMEIVFFSVMMPDLALGEISKDVHPISGNLKVVWANGYWEWVDSESNHIRIVK